MQETKDGIASWPKRSQKLKKDDDQTNFHFSFKHQIRRLSDPIKPFDHQNK